jgi:hypothetical protein
MRSGSRSATAIDGPFVGPSGWWATIASLRVWEETYVRLVIEHPVVDPE